MEALIVVGLSTLITVGVVIGLLEGMGALSKITTDYDIEYGHQRAMSSFMRDVQAAQWFYNGEVHNEMGSLVLNETASPYDLVLGYPGPDGDEIWIRYRSRAGALPTRLGFVRNYLIRTVISTSGLEEGATLLAVGVTDLQFNYENVNRTFTDRIPDIYSVGMTLSLDINGTLVRREYVAVMRNPNLGPKLPPGDFNEIESENLFK